MTQSCVDLSEPYLETQRRRLIALRDALRAACTLESQDSRAINADPQGSSRECEQDAQRMAGLEINAQIRSHDLHRIHQVERAMAKIDEGTYGLSDHSGARISIARLDALPEATCTLKEQSALDFQW